MSSHQPRWILSGGLASGKSQVRRLLERHGIHTIDADEIGHEVLRSSGPAFAGVARRWPQVIEAGEVDRAALASVVFNDAEELTALEGITHPHIFDSIASRVEGYDGPVIVEMPVLSHSLGSDWRRAVVDCADDIRLRRAIDRGMSESDARARMASQPSRAAWLAVADLVIPNHGSQHELAESVSRVVERLSLGATRQ